ncbi:M23 family metallopeptidase [Litorilituus sediminis]|uniref:M23 family metallopeptidase n=1 Tax=Litorilituus sediminis TaxID=718192 RepID=UPI001476F7D4|nr:M23 family metallopeptidase [Litorilituus sediminis]
MKIQNIIFSLIFIFFSFPLFGKDLIKIHSIHKETFSCTEHWAGQFKYAGDALGTDCVIGGWYEDEKRLFQKSFINDGFKNEDWFGFKKNVLAPCDCEVIDVSVNEVTNEPGIMTPGRASSIVFQTANGSKVLLAHVRDIKVKKGDLVKQGNVVAKVGNNGYSRSPHIHIGAWDVKGNPLQIRFDQKTLSLSDRE